MIGTSISARYAEGLLKVAIRSNKINQVEENLFDFVESVWQNKNVKNFLTHPKLGFDIKKQLLDSMIKSKYDILTVEFLVFLIKKNRVNQIVPITYKFDELNDKFQGVLKVDVMSAYPVSEGFLNLLKGNLEEITGRKIKFNIAVNPLMIVGVKIKIGDLVIENSLEHKLQDFLNRIELRR